MVDVSSPPPIDGVRRRFVEARGVRFHVTEAGTGRPVLVLHGWPQHHYAYRDLLADPPPGLRIIAPDLPGYGWSGPAPHRWVKQEVADDVLALMDALDLERVLLVGHDWGGYIGWLMVLANPERFTGFVPLNIPHPWQHPSSVVHAWRLAHMPVMAAAGEFLQRRTPFVTTAIRLALVDKAAMTGEDIAWFAERFRDPVCARAGQDTYRTLLTREVPVLARERERRRTSVPIRGVFGKDDFAVHHSLASPATAHADDYELELVPGAGHFVEDERPDIVRRTIVELTQ